MLDSEEWLQEAVLLLIVCPFCHFYTKVARGVGRICNRRFDAQNLKQDYVYLYDLLIEVEEQYGKKFYFLERKFKRGRKFAEIQIFKNIFSLFCFFIGILYIYICLLPRNIYIEHICFE